MTAATHGASSSSSTPSVAASAKRTRDDDDDHHHHHHHHAHETGPIGTTADTAHPAAKPSASAPDKTDRTGNQKIKKPKRSQVSVAELLALSAVPADRSYLLEHDVGITHYLNPLQTQHRLSAIIKHRFTDFLVHEVDPAGNILHLTKEDVAAVPASGAQPAKRINPFTAARDLLDSLDPAIWTHMRTFFEDADADARVERVKDLLRNGPPPPKHNNKNHDRGSGSQRGGRGGSRDGNASHGEHGSKTSKADVKSESANEVQKTESVSDAAKTEYASEVTKTESTDLKVEASADSKDIKMDNVSTMPAKTDATDVTPSPVDEEILTKSFPDKQARIDVYDFFKKHFFEVLATDSRPNQRICIRWFTARDRARSNPRPDFSKGEHLQFILYKENKDTMECLNTLARYTNTHGKDFTFAGTKDKRAVTVQRCSGYKVLQSKMEGVHLGKQVAVGGFKYVKDRVNLGDLSANHFVLTLRDVELVQDDPSTPQDPVQIPIILEKSLTSLAQNGFINYYGMQRFGTRNISTHQVGLAMLSSSWATAVELIMMPKGDENAEFVEARRLWMEERDARRSFNAFPRGCVAERAVMGAMMKERKEDPSYLTALNAVPRNLRLMYLHAVQSFVWNHMASERMRVYGNRVVPGDLVARFNQLSSRARDAGDAVEAGAADIEEHRAGRMIEVDVIASEEDAATRSIEDLVLPLPGYEVKYPSNAIGQAYVTFMAKYGLDPHDMKRHNRDISLPGDYRRVVIRPKNVAWKSLRYDDPQIPLSRTDMDVINGVPEPVSLPDGKRLGVVVEFSLETSSYATMALREILRTDTSAGHQGTLTRASNVVTDAERKERETQEAESQDPMKE
ncbi:pseudouridine synthase [Chytriomyces sp. MP71]|nr:pseudouridine synthase [Chytriomyces sp. MP71]